MTTHFRPTHPRGPAENGMNAACMRLSFSEEVVSQRSGLRDRMKGQKQGVSGKGRGGEVETRGGRERGAREDGPEALSVVAKMRGKAVDGICL